MIISPQTGTVVHHNDCTYCTFRMSISFKSKGRMREVEKCGLTLGLLPMERCCAHYCQENCGCERCRDVADLNQM